MTSNRANLNGIIQLLNLILNIWKKKKLLSIYDDVSFFREFNVFSIENFMIISNLGPLQNVPPHKRLLNRGQHSFPKLSQSRCTFQIPESWPRPQVYPIITPSAWNFEKPSWPLINLRLRAAKVRFTQSDFRVYLRALHNLSEGKKRRKKVTLGSRSGSRFYTITILWVVFSLSTLYLKTVDWSLTTRI